MKHARTLSLIAALAFAAPLHAQVCSGGKDGGTDATGNQCTDPASVAVDEGARTTAAKPPAVTSVSSMHRRTDPRPAAPSAQRSRDAFADASFSRAQR